MATSFQSTCFPIIVGCILEDGYGGFVVDGYYSNGVNWYLVTGGSGEVTATGSCTTTTTSTTTTLAYNSFLLAYSASTGGDACSNYPTLFTNTYYTDPAINYLSNDVIIYQDPGLTSPAGDGYYSDGTHYWITSSFSGDLQSQTLCPGVTTTTTTTIDPGALTPYTLHYSSISGEDACTTSNYTTVYSSCNPLSAECLLWYDAAGTVVADEYFYADQANNILYEMYVTHLLGTGEIYAVSSCTTTTTSTTTTTTVYPYGDFELDPAYGINITSLIASSGTLPGFTFPRVSGNGQTLDMVSGYTISTVFTVGISGTRLFGTNKTITLYVNSIARACQVITSDGPQTKSLTSSVAILDTDNVTIAIDNAASC